MGVPRPRASASDNWEIKIAPFFSGLRREKSAGAVLFSDAGGKLEYLLLHYTAGHWDFPKGNVERGEGEIEAALREVEEETGIRDAEIIFGFRREITYFYKLGGETIKKTVAYYLARAPTKDVRISWEHVGYAWLPYEQAVEKLTFKSSKEILKEAHSYLSRLLARGST